MIPKGPKKKKTIIINRSVLIVVEILTCLIYTYSIIPKEIREKIQEIINLIYDKYIPFPEHENDVELYDEIYKITYEYAEYLK